MTSSTVLCPHCKKPRSYYSQFCSHCGARFMLSVAEAEAMTAKTRQGQGKNPPAGSLLARLLKRMGLDKF